MKTLTNCCHSSQYDWLNDNKKTTVSTICATCKRQCEIFYGDHKVTIKDNYLTKYTSVCECGYETVVERE